LTRLEDKIRWFEGKTETVKKLKDELEAIKAKASKIEDLSTWLNREIEIAREMTQSGKRLSAKLEETR
jgi:hypothetical protein